MRILSVGGGPAGLYFGLLAKQADPAREITVLERNGPDDTFGFGVVFSDRTLRALRRHDAETYDAIADALVRWDDIEVRHRGRSLRSGGHGFSAIARRRLLQILQRRALEVGVDVRFHQNLDLAAERGVDGHALDAYDLVVAADGVNSGLRARHAGRLEPTFAVGAAKYIWFGTTKVYDSFCFAFDSQRTPQRATFVARAHGDLDGDGERSTFEVHGEATPDGVRLLPGLYVDREVE